jgi:hypothetical protein
MSDPLVTARHERMRDLFGVALVHLATIGLDKEFRHGRTKTIHGEQRSSKTQNMDFYQHTSIALSC